MPQDKINAYMTLYTVLVETAKVAAPFVPFMTEEIYRNLVKSVDKSAPESIHLCDYPQAQSSWIDKELEKNMDLVLQIVVQGRACRNTAAIKNRQPIGKMYVKSDFELPKDFQILVQEELNVKEVHFTEDVQDFTTYSFKPQLKTVGPKYGKQLPAIREALDHVDGNVAMAQLRQGKPLSFTLQGQEIILTEEDLLIEAVEKEGFVAETDQNVAVVLDTNLTPQLIEEGFVREVISKLQTMRKEAGFEVQDHILVYYRDNDRIEQVIKNNEDLIKQEVLAKEIGQGSGEGYEKQWNINGETVIFTVQR